MSPHTISPWGTRYRAQGADGLHVTPPGRPPGTDRARRADQEQALRRLVAASTPHEQQIASGMWTRQAVAELIASRLGIALTVPGVGTSRRRWGVTPQKPARQARD